MDLFPEISFDRSKLQTQRIISFLNETKRNETKRNKTYKNKIITIIKIIKIISNNEIYSYCLLSIILLVEWQSKETRKLLFEAYATENQFDPLVKENWYSQSRKRVFAFTVWCRGRWKKSEKRKEKKRGDKANHFISLYLFYLK
jgi:hypothetical protein